MKKLFFKGTLALFLSLIIIFTGMMKINKDDKPVYKDSAAPIDQRVNDLLSRMTLEEKIDMLGGTGFATKPNKRLGIPELRMTDGPLGVRWEKSSAFPGGIALASPGILPWRTI